MIQGKTIYRATGCPDCLETGYDGRTAIHEIMLITDEVRDLIIANADGVKIKKQAMAQGMRTLRELAAVKMLNGETTFEEVMLVTQEDVARVESS